MFCFVPISINDKDLDYVTEVKILGLNISNNLLWNDHISDMIKKANKRIYFLILLKDGAYYCYCAYVLRIFRYSDFLSPMLTNTGIFLRGLKLSGESRS